MLGGGIERHGVNRGLNAALAALLVLAACSGDDDRATSDPTPSATQSDDSTAPPSSATLPPPPTTTPRPTQTLGVADPDTGEVTEVEVPAAGPTTFDQVIDFGIDAGLWDEIGGVTAVLDFIVGALPAEQVPGVDEILTGEVTDVLLRAEALIEQGAGDDDARAVLEQRLSLILPSPETLDQIADQPGALRSGFAPVPASPTAGCAPVDPNDWDVAAWLEGCYKVVERQLPDATLRVFYPAWYDDDASLASLTTVTLDALEKSITTFRPLGPVGDIDAIFSATDTVENDNTLGSAIRSRSNGVVDGCRVSLWPVSSAESIDAFSQTVAHEAWHCVQYYDGMDPTGDARWFVEGGAEFFSNVAYPTVDDEHGWIATFDEGVKTPLHSMEYEAWIWWQHLANEFSPSWVADLHRQMYGTGLSLDAVGGLEPLFHDFVSDYVAGVVIDQSGAALPRARMFLSPRMVTEDDQGRQVGAAFTSWAPVRWYLSYDKELRVLQTDSSTGGTRSMAAWTERSDRPSWTGVVPEIRSTCTEKANYAVVTTDASTDPTTSTLDFRVVIDTVERAECDPCLLGTWSLDLNTFADQIRGGVEAQDGFPAGASLDLAGAYYTAFDDSSTVLQQRDDLMITMTLEGVGPIIFTINSFGSGRYTADGETLTIDDFVETSNDVTTSFPFGATYSFPGAIDDGVGTYICDADNLHVTIDAYAPVSFARVDKILTPPEAPTDPSTDAPDP